MEEKAEPEIEEGAGGRVGESGPASGQKRQPCESVEGRKVDKGGEDSCLTFQITLRITFYGCPHYKNNLIT